ncbi:MAG: glycosyltransferase family 4 protein [Sulfurimonas sp.]|nr:glycosyltransferase family 4 protein [Sulfurimonas sp.]MBU3940033.1 glycosyltransferase family 4 protein [bacterium]MBU4025576.1 glycosyltransferase family 4 protein [bacterium]MBU4059072.1 glycosyltransferase family 4 protein [bacterium]MBU4110511.1 glycosyltransferase family 4 protein [bacterium]
MTKKTLLELCMSPDLGGLELYMVRAAKALRDDFNVISIINENSKLEQYYDEDNTYIKIKKTSNLFMFGAAKKLANVIDEHDVDIIHMHWTKDIPFVVLAKLLSKKKPKIAQTRNMTMTRFKDDFYHRFLYKNMDLLLPVTYQVKEQLEQFIPAEIRPKVEVLYMGSDKPELLNDAEVQVLKDELGLSSSAFNLGMVGRINEAKGQHLLIRALAHLQDMNVHVYFVGHEMRKGYTQELKKLSHELGVENQVHFLGFMKNPHHFYQACDAIVLASKRETFGLVLIEAMQVGTAVIGANSGGVVEIIDDEKTGFLFESQNAESLAAAIEKLVKNPQLLESVANAGQQKCQEKFSNVVQFEKLAEILNTRIN